MSLDLTPRTTLNSNYYDYITLAELHMHSAIIEKNVIRLGVTMVHLCRFETVVKVSRILVSETSEHKRFHGQHNASL
jgi:hypothetical protein